MFEVVRNEPGDAPMSEVTKTPTGVVTVSDEAGRFLYKVRPQDEIRVVFGKKDGGQVSVLVTDKKIQVGVATIKNSRFDGEMAGVVIRPNGGVDIGASIPPALLHWLQT